MTAQRSGSSFNPSMRLSAAISAMELRLYKVALAIWGVTLILGWCQNKWSFGNGSSRKTSRHAPDFRAERTSREELTDKGHSEQSGT